jgi:diguanylate cyclase (GGDEF)-like protein
LAIKQFNFFLAEASIMSNFQNAEKKARREKTIGRRIGNLVALSVILAMTLTSILLGAFQLKESLKARRTELESTSFVFASAVAEATAAADREAIQRVFHSVKHLQNVLGVYAVDRNEQVITSSGQQTYLRNQMASGDPGLLEILSSGSMAVSVNVVRGGEQVGRLVMIGDISNVKFLLLRTLAMTLLAAIAAVVFTLILSRRMQKRITNPIVMLTKTMKAVRLSHQYEITDIPHAESETRELVETFNAMATEIHDRDASLRKLAYFDTLTALPNRINFQRILETKLDGHFAICVLDIDNFKTINDTLGQTAGDILLKEIAKMLGQSASEHVVARLAADEFILFLKNCKTAEDARSILAPFLAELYSPITILDQRIFITVCVGVALANLQDELPAELSRHASLALAQARREGTGRVVFFEQRMAEASQEEAEIEIGLRDALKANQLEVHYQPIVQPNTRVVEGYEALMRWKHPQKGYISPAKFIPVAEKAGLINELGFWIMRQSCIQAKLWSDAGEPERFVSVNVSAGQIMVAQFIESVDEILLETGLSPHLLCLELTESMFAGRSMKLVQSILNELKARKIITALDDFGTGYSTLSYLEHLPFDKLKVDRAFVHNKDASQTHEQLLKGVITLAHALGISVVAEGAETAAEVSLLQKFGVETIQGYFYSKPVPAQDVLGVTAQIEQSGRKVALA